MHYNEGADLLTYLVDPLVFEIKNGYVPALTGGPVRSCRVCLHTLMCVVDMLRAGTGH